MHQRIAGRKTKFLNLDGRTVLAKVTLSNIPTHIMHYIKVPSRVLELIDKTQRDFLWGSNAEKKNRIFLIGTLSPPPKAMGV